MAQWSTTIRNLWISTTEAEIGPLPVIRIRTGNAPVNCAAADAGTVLATIPLPIDWLSTPTTGVASKLGVWQDIEADATGAMGHFRLYDADDNCHLQGSITLSDGGGDMEASNLSVVAGVSFTIDSFLATATGA